MPFLTPQKGDSQHTLAFKLAYNSVNFSYSPMTPQPGYHLHDLLLIAAQNLSNASTSPVGQSQVVTTPTSTTDWSMFPGGTKPTSGVYFAPRDNNTIWSLDGANDTSWKVIDRNSP